LNQGKIEKYFDRRSNMKFFSRTVLLLAVVLFIFTIVSYAQENAREAAKWEVRDFLGKLFEINKVKDIKKIETFYSHNADVVFIGPTGKDRWVGWTSFHKHIAPIYADKSFKYAKMDFRDAVIYPSKTGDFASFSVIVDTAFDFKGKTVEVPGTRFSGAVEKVDGKWKIVQHVYFVPLPAEEDQ
jgi:hypothetical protein